MAELLIPELQKRGIYWSDYAAPGGTARENMLGAPGVPLLAPEHPGAKVRWNAPSAVTTTESVSESTHKKAKIEEVKGADLASTIVATTEISA